MDDTSSIAVGVVIVFLIVLGLSPVIVLWVYIIYQNSKRKKIRERILASRADLIGNNRWFPARYASQTRFDAIIKFFPWEAAGIIVITPGALTFLGETFAGATVSLQFGPGNSRINWLGKCPWPNGAVSWIRFDTANGQHYFSSETGIFIIGSHPSTKAIYDEANRNFGAPPAQNL